MPKPRVSRPTEVAMVVMYAFMVYVGFRFSVLAAVNTSNEVEIPEGELKEAFISRANGGSS